MKSRLHLGIVLFCVAVASASADFTRNIMLTGFWPPTNEMLRPFSNNPEQNPGGWTGQNWESRGYDIYSYFPEFSSFPEDGRGTGDFEVDYQDTSADFWRIVEEVKPIAIITFSLGSRNRAWELESRNRKLPLDQWVPDYLEPFRPTADLPIASEPDLRIRNSSLPMDAIREAVNAAAVGATAVIDQSDAFGGNFVSEFVGYHGNWYHDLNADPNGASWNIAAGHIHVGTQVGLTASRAATDITLRTLTAYLDTVIPEPSSITLLVPLLVLFSRRRHG